MDTIFALATAAGKSGVAVVRISGPDAYQAACDLTRTSLPERGMCLRDVYDRSGARLDQALVLTFAEPASFTGESVAELQLHGSMAVVAAVLRELSDIKGLRIADPGEFTRRALENGKMDLAQVEGLADLIDSETEAQRKQAQKVLTGELGAVVEAWRRDLVRAASLIEATIDFADEDVPVDVTPEVTTLLAAVQDSLKKESWGVQVAERIRHGFEVAIVGAPNVGKSTLLNALAGRDAAITSEIAGTTRDVIEVQMDLSGLPVTILDTAGLRDTSDVIEALGVSLARKRAAAADLRVFLSEDESEFQGVFQANDIWVIPKADQRADKSGAVSGVTGEGLDDLVSRITKELRRRTLAAGVATRERHRLAIVSAMESLEDAHQTLLMGPDHYDIVAENIRRGIRALESLVGRIDVEMLLDEIFSSFCLGK